MTAPVEWVTFHVLICKECSPDGDLQMPFTSQEERGRWAAEHTRGTGHDSWFVGSTTLLRHPEGIECEFGEHGCSCGRLEV